MAAVGVCRRGMHRMSRPLRRGRRGIRDRLPEAAPPLSSPPFARAAARQTSRFAPCVRGLRRLRSAPLEPPDAASSALSFREAGAWVPRGGPRTGKGRAPQGGPYGSFRPASVPVRTSWAGDGPYSPRSDRKRSAEALLGRATGRTPTVRHSRRGEERGPRGERRIGRRETLRVSAAVGRPRTGPSSATQSGATQSCQQDWYGGPPSRFRPPHGGPRRAPGDCLKQKGSGVVPWWCRLASHL